MILVVLAGAGTAIQTGMNAQLRESFGHTLTSSAINFSIGLTLLIALVLALRIPLPSTSAILQTPTWAWFGGLIGASFVATIAYASRDLGMLLTFSLIIAGQVIGSALLDHFGVMGFTPRPFNLNKLLGTLLLIAGLMLVKRS